MTTLNTPPLNSYDANFTAQFFELNFQNGGSFGQFRIKVSNSFLTGNDTVGFGLEAGYASAPTIVGVNVENLIESLVTQSGGAQTSILNTNATPRRLGWWQIQ